MLNEQEVNKNLNSVIRQGQLRSVEKQSKAWSGRIHFGYCALCHLSMCLRTLVKHDEDWTDKDQARLVHDRSAQSMFTKLNLKTPSTFKFIELRNHKSSNYLYKDCDLFSFLFQTEHK